VPGKKKVIHAETEFEGILLGIVTQLRDYQLCWHLNKMMNFEMKMMNDLEITHKKKNKTALFSWFKYEDELDKLMVYLISNRHSGEYLLPEMKQADFIFMVQGEVTEERRKEIFNGIKQINAVQLTIDIKYNKLKSKANLVME